MIIFKFNKLSYKDYRFIKEAGGQGPAKIPLSTFINRMETLGWSAKLNKAADNWLLNIKTKDENNYSITVGIKAWDKTNGYRMTHKVLRSQCPDVADIVFKNKFEIPKNFNKETQKIEETQTQYEIKIIPLSIQLPSNLDKYDIFTNNEWTKILDVDWINMTIINENGEILPIPSKNIKIRKEISLI